MRTLVTLLFWLAAPAAFAATPVLCNSCVTDSDFRAAAAFREAATHSGGAYWVYNLRDGTVQKWAFPAGGRSNGQRAPRSANASSGTGIRQAVESHVRSEVDKAHTLYIIAGDSLRPIYNVPIEALNLEVAAGKSIYDVLRDNNLKARIESSLGSTETLVKVVNQGVVGALVNIAQMATNVLGIKEGTYVIFRLVMSDGTYMDFFHNITQTTADAQENTARTASGQLIPESLAQTTGRWNSSPIDDLGRMADYMQELGANIEFGGAGNVIRSISCTPQACLVEKRIQ